MTTANGHATIAPGRHRFDVSVIKAAITNWPDALHRVGGIPLEVLDGQHHPCLRCGGTDRFSLVDSDAGAVLCRKCFDSKNGDGIAAIQWARGWSFTETLDALAEYAGLVPEIPASSLSSPSGADVLLRVCRSKRMPVDSAIAYGAKVERWGSDLVVNFPYYDQGGTVCSNFALYAVDDQGAKFPKGRNAKGLPTGMFLPHVDGKVRLPRPGETWVIDEGVKNAAALHSLGYLAAGYNGSQLQTKHAEVFRGVHVMMTPNLDGAAQKGSAKNGKRLAGVAASIKIARLPGEPGQNVDVRDVLAMDNGETLLRQAIANANAFDGYTASESPSEPTLPVPVTPSSEFFGTTFERRWLVDSVLVANEPCIVAAKAKGCKTTLAIGLVLALGAGVPWLEKFPTHRCRVAFLSGESGQYTIQETARRIANAMGINPALGDVFWGFRLPCLGDPAGLESLAMMLEDVQPAVVVIDPVYLSLMGSATTGLSASNLFDVGPLLAGIVNACLQHGATPILIHHLRKNSALERFAPPELEELAMAGFGEFARQWILLGRRSEYLSDGRHELWMQIGGSAGHGSLWALDINEGRIDDPSGRKWEVSLGNAKDARETAKQAKADAKARFKTEQLEADKRAICEALAAAESLTATKASVKAATCLRTDRIDAAIALLIKEKSVRTTTITKGNNRRYKALQMITNQGLEA